MELSQANQIKYITDRTARDQALRNALSGLYYVVKKFEGFYLTLYRDEDREEGLKKNFYEIIGPKGERYIYSGNTYRLMENKEFELIVQEIQQGVRKPYTISSGEQLC